jgi:hypothetical protein
MPSDGPGQPRESNDRVARGFEALVDEEPLLVRPPSPAAPAAAAPVPATSADAGRLDVLEQRVRVTMDRLTELVEAQLPEAVDGLRGDLDGLRGDFEQLRSDLHLALAESHQRVQAALVDAHRDAQLALGEASRQLIEERQQLRSQIAITVGAANRWFVRTRDELYQRLEQIAAVATAALPPATPTYPELEAVPEAEVVPSDGEADQAAVAVEWDVEEPLPPLETGPAPEEPFPSPEPSELEPSDLLEPLEPAETFEPPQPVQAPTMSVVLDAPELETLVAPLRDDVQELQGEVSAMAEALFQLREDVERLGQRLPARTPTARLTPRQVATIVEAVQEALPARRAAPVARAAPSRAARVTKAATSARGTGRVGASKAASPSTARGATSAAARKVAGKAVKKAAKATKSVRATGVAKKASASAIRSARTTRPRPRY